MKQFYKSRRTPFRRSPTGKWLLLCTMLITTAFIIHSCKKENKSVDSNQAVADAKNWYESTFPVLSTVPGSRHLSLSRTPGEANTTGVDYSQLVKPDWEHSASYNRLGKAVIETPIDASSKYNFSLKTDVKTFNPAYSRSSFLVLKSGSTYAAYVMMVVADSSYVKNDTSKLSHNTYRKHDADFSGLVLYFTPKGKFISSWGYKNGKLLPQQGVAEPTAGSNLSLHKATGAKNLDGDLYTICVMYYTRVMVNGAVVSDNFDYSDCFSYSGSGGGGGSIDVPPYIDPSGGSNPGTVSPCPPVTTMSASSIKATAGKIPVNGPPDPGFPDPTPTTSNCYVVQPVVDSTEKMDPCANKLLAATAINNIVKNNTSISNAFSAAATNSTSGYESAFHIDYSSGVYTASTPVQTTSESATYSSTNANATTVALGHGHDALHSPVPSPYDAYATGEKSISTQGLMKTDYIISATAKYSIAVTDINAFKSYFTGHDETNLEKDAGGNFTGDFSGSSAVGGDVTVVEQFATAAYFVLNNIDVSVVTVAQSTAAGIYANEVGMVYFFGTYNTGLTLLKADANGNFQPLHLTSQTSSTGKIVYFSSPCN